MGLYNFPTAAEGLLPVLVMNTVVSVALLKNMLRSLLHVVGASWKPDMGDVDVDDDDDEQSCVARRMMSITQYKCMVSESGGTRSGMAECCVCLCGFRASEEVSELSCKHFFHTACLDKWFLNRRPTCPLCRSTS